MTVRSTVEEMITQVAAEHHKPAVPLHDDLLLIESGLDSLCLAVVVARLEDVLHVDPFGGTGEAPFPVTVGDFVSLYENAKR